MFSYVSNQSCQTQHCFIGVHMFHKFPTQDAQTTYVFICVHMFSNNHDNNHIFHKFSCVQTFMTNNNNIWFHMCSSVFICSNQSYLNNMFICFHLFHMLPTINGNIICCHMCLTNHVNTKSSFSYVCICFNVF